MAGDEDERPLGAGFFISPDLGLCFEAIAFLLRRGGGRQRVDVVAEIHVVVDLILHAEVRDVLRDAVGLVDELEFHGTFAPLGDLLAPGTADEVLIEIGGRVVAGHGAGVDHDEAAAAGRELFDPALLVGLEVAATLAVDDEHVGAAEFFVRREGLHAFIIRVADGYLHAGGVEQRAPVAGEGRVVVVARAVGLRAAAEEHAERGGGIGGEDRDEREQGQEAAHGGRLSAKVQKCKGVERGRGRGGSGGSTG